MFCMCMIGFSGNSLALCELLGGLFHALRLCWLRSPVCLIDWVRNLYALKEQQEGLNHFLVTLLKQVVLVLPLQQAHVQDVACKFRICEGLDLLCMPPCTRTVDQTREVINVNVQLQYALHKPCWASSDSS